MSRFALHQAEGVAVLRSSLFEAAGIRHGFSTRVGGVSTGPYESLNLRLNCGDTRENVWENYARFGRAVGFDPADSAMTKQVHRAEVRKITMPEGLYAQRPECDALVTDRPGIALMSFGADCVTILLCDPAVPCAAAVHAGWRGAVAGTLTNAVESLCREYGARPERMLAAIGPAVSGANYEVDAAVAEQLRSAHALTPGEEAAMMPARGEKYYPDLRSFAVLRLLKAGLKHEQIDCDDHCTYAEPGLFWSHRRAGDARGVHAAVIVL